MLAFKEGVTITPEMTVWLDELNAKLEPLVDAAVVDLILYGSCKIATKTFTIRGEKLEYGRGPAS